MEDSKLPIEYLDKSYLNKVQALKDDWYKFYKDISKTDTPMVDGSGNKIVRKRPDNLDYIIEAFMKDRLNYYFPGWSWKDGTTQLLGAEWVIRDGTLAVIDERLLAFGINPPYRYFSASGAARIQFKSGMPHTPENLVDLDKNVKAANSNCFKKAINQLTGIGDDVYGKRIEEEGAGSYESILEVSPDKNNFAMWFENTYGSKHWGKAFEILGIKKLEDIKDFKQAMETVKEKL